MKRIVILFLTALFAASGASAQKFHNAYYDTRRAAHDEEGLQQGAIVFLGNSITEQGWWSLLLKRGDVENRGIGGDNTFGMIDRLPDILKSKPRKIFLMAGINDLTGGQPVDTIVMNITRMADMVHEAVPGCRLYIQSVLPVNTRRLAIPDSRGTIRRCGRSMRGWCGCATPSRGVRSSILRRCFPTPTVSCAST